MTIRVSVLNSSQPNAGTKPFDSELDIVRTHFSCPGRLPHPEHTNTAIAQLQGTNILVQESAWLVPVRRPGSPLSYEAFKVLFQVTADELIPTGGAQGVVVARVFASSVFLGATGSVTGSAEGQLEFIPGQNLTDTDIDTALGGDFWVRVADYAFGIPAGTNLAASSTPTASSVTPGFEAPQTIDGSFSTYWLNSLSEPISTNSATLTYDLGSAQSIDSFTLSWFFSTFVSNNFQVETSLDGTTWTPLGAPITSGYGSGQISQTFPAIVTRHVRFVFAANSGTHPSYVAVAEVEIFATGGNSLTQGGMAVLQPSTGLKLEGSHIDMAGGSINYLADATHAHQAVNLGQIQSLVSPSGGGGFFLLGTRTGLSNPRILTWDDVLQGAGQYEIQRQIGTGQWVAIVTLLGSTTTYTDTDIISGDVNYRIKAVNPTIAYNQTSNAVSFTGSTAAIYACSDYGSGRDGAYTGGDLLAGKVYEFTSFTLNNTMSFTGEGQTIVLVQNDLTINSGQINLAYTNQNLFQDVRVCGQTRSVAIAPFSVVSGGAGGPGGFPAVSGNASGTTGGTGGFASVTRGGDGNSGMIGASGGFVGGLGGAAGTALSPNGQNGEDGYEHVQTLGSTNAGGGGGAGGDGISRGSLIFVVGGNVSINASSILSGEGGAGGNGGRGGRAADNNTGVGAGGGGGGGAGGNGGDGGHVKIFHPSSATVSATPIEQLSGGAGGTGGQDGLGGVSSAIGFASVTSPTGLAGSHGNTGRPGGLELIAV